MRDTGSATSQITQRRSRILVVDDDPGVARVLTRVAQNLGFEATAVIEPSQVVASVKRLRPEMILLDLSMPGLDGVEVLRALAAAGSRAQVCLISGAGRDVIDAARALGDELGLRMAKSLHKPLGHDQIERALRAIEQGAVAPGPSRPEPSVDDLDEALRTQSIVPHYQPKVDLVSGHMTGVEVLARWTSAELGVVPPGIFIPMAEASGAIGRLTHCIASRAFEELAGFGGGASGLGIAVNLSPLLLHDLEYPDRLLELAVETGVDPGRVTMEVTESEAMKDPTRYMDILVRFRLKGFHLSVDDFGTGFSSLVHLYKLPFEEIKIDRAFVSDLRQSQEACVIVKAMIALGKGLGLSVVAEGIEDRETAEMLEHFGCEAGQGYYFGAPEGIEELRRRRSPG